MDGEDQRGGCEAGRSRSRLSERLTGCAGVVFFACVQSRDRLQERLDWLGERAFEVRKVGWLDMECINVYLLMSQWLVRRLSLDFSLQSRARRERFCPKRLAVGDLSIID